MSLLKKVSQVLPPSTVEPAKVSLAARLGRTNVALPQEQVIVEKPKFGRAVNYSPDFERVKNLPRRKIDPSKHPVNIHELDFLKKAVEKCDCKERWGFCIRELKPIQAHMLLEARLIGGLLAPVGVGGGKTGADILLPMVVPGVKVAVLLVPPNLKSQFLERDYPQWSAHFRVPELAGQRFLTEGVPKLHVISYHELSSAKSSDKLKQIQPQLIIADEAHNLRRKESARTKRFLRHFNEFSNTALAALSGTMTSKSLHDYQHLAAVALKRGAPVPLHYPTVEEWAGVLDASDCTIQIGVLRGLCDVGEDVRAGFRRRLVETPGVVATEETTLKTALVIDERKPKSVPLDVQEHLRKVRISWQRPDGEELTDALTQARVCQQVACGFYYRWRWPRMEPVPVIQKWLEVRREWHRELRERLKHAREFMDSPLLLTRAAIRWYDGYTHVDPVTNKRTEYPPFTKKGPLPVWESFWWPAWKEVRETARPETEAVWISEFLVDDAVEWGKENVGIIWYEHDALGRKIAQKGGFAHFGPGQEASSSIIHERGNRTIVASLKAHGTGKNLQMFCDQLFVNFPSDGAAAEQNLGRTHRPGQMADEVHANIYRFTEEMHGAFETAAARAKYIQETLGSQQKLLYASYGFPVFFKTTAPKADPEAIEECGCRPGLKCPEHDF